MNKKEWFFLIFIFLMSCNSFDSIQESSSLSDNLIQNKIKKQKKTMNQDMDFPSYSENPEFGQSPVRLYSRSTHDQLKNESELDTRIGSLWIPEGQEAYLFTENTVRLVGDPLIIKLEGDPKDQLEAKMNAIGSLLKKIEEQKKIQEEQIEKNKQNNITDGDQNNDQENKQASLVRGVKKKRNEVQKDVQKSLKENEKIKLEVKSIPSRIVEKLSDGTYRVEGGQYVMIGEKEYKIIVSGILKSPDFTDQGVSAEKLIESKFDIVTSKRKQRDFL